MPFELAEVGTVASFVGTSTEEETAGRESSLTSIVLLGLCFPQHPPILNKRPSIRSTHLDINAGPQGIIVLCPMLLVGCPDSQTESNSYKFSCQALKTSDGGNTHCCSHRYTLELSLHPQSPFYRTRLIVFIGREPIPYKFITLPNEMWCGTYLLEALHLWCAILEVRALVA